jgi:hypothetical protein
MKKILFILILTSTWSFSQIYKHPTSGLNSTYAGACMVNTCSGTYTDNGGTTANYAANINAIYRTFCPNAAGKCVRATFTSFSMNDTYFLCFGPNSCCDYLQILNGPYHNSTALYSNCTSSPGTITASNPSGCLTFRHQTDGSVQLGGWAATLSCVSCSGGPVAGVNTDCSGAVQICSDTQIASSSTGPGLSSDDCTGSFSSGGEAYSSWYAFEILNSGTFGFIIDPTNNSNDFDFALFGPGVSCGTLGQPVRCSYAGNTGNTGMGNFATDNSENITGNGWVQTMPVTAGQIYYLMINTHSSTNSGYLIDLTLTGGATLNCSQIPLAVQLTDFYCLQEERSIEIKWRTESEVNSDYFVLEKSEDGMQFYPFIQTKAQGNTSLPTDYIISDNIPVIGINYYRLTEVDMDGERKTYDITSCDFNMYSTKIKTSRIYSMSGTLLIDINGEDINLKETFSNINLPDAVYILETIDYSGHIERIKFVQIKGL